MKIQTKYICEVTGEEFDTEEEALLSEEKFNRNSIFIKLFPKEHPDDNRYKTHCVNCGKLMWEYESTWDGHRNETGDLIKSNPIFKLFGGGYCIECYNKVYDTIVSVLIQNKERFK